jgi:hypothetical protein
MAIAFRAVGAAKKNTGSGNMASVALPAGHVTNDILVCKIMAADNIVCTMSAGWTKKLGLNSSTICRYEEWWKRDGGSEVAPTVTHAAGNDAQCWIEAYSGVDSGLADPYRDAQTQTGNGTATGNFTVTMPALTGVVSGDYLLATPVYGDNNTDGTPAFSTPTGFTSRVAVTSNVAGTADCSGAAFTLLATGSAGSITSTSAWNGTGTPSWVGAQTALSSAASGGAAFIARPNKLILQAVNRAGTY